MTLFRGLPREVAILSVVAFTVALGFGIQAPAIPVFAAQFGVGEAAVGALVSAFAFMRFATNLPGGWLIQRLDERVVLTTGMTLLAVTSVLAGLSWNFPLLFVFRAACGIGSALYTVSAISLLLTVTPASHRGRAAGLLQGSFSIGTVAGPAVGGGLLELSPRLPFFVYGAAVGVACVIATIALARATRAHESPLPADAAAPRIPISRALEYQSYRAALTTYFGLGWAVFGVRVSVLPLFLLNVLQAGPTWIGIALAVGAMVQAFTMPPSGRMADLWGRRPTLIAGEIVVFGGWIMVIAWQELAGYMTAFALMGLGTALCGTAAAALVGDVTQGRGGTAVSGYQMAADFGMIVGPLTVGWLASAYSYQTAFLTTATVVLAGLVMAVAMKPRGI